jgi:hypothetical protein
MGDFEVKQDGATLKQLVSERTSFRDQNKKVPVYRQRVYLKGDKISEDVLAPIHIEQYENDEGNIRDLIKRVGSGKTSKKQSS